MDTFLAKELMTISVSQLADRDIEKLLDKEFKNYNKAV